MSTIKVVMQTEFSEQMSDAVKKNEMLQDEAVRAQVQIHNVSARAETHLQKIQAELQAHRDEHRQTQQESNSLRSERSGMEHRMADMSNGVAILRDRLQQRDQEMSTNHGRLKEVSQHIDIEARRRMIDSEYNISRFEG